MRLFVAVDLPEEYKRAIGEQINSYLGKYKGIRWVKGSQLHLTLKFLGHLSRDLLPGVEDALEKIAEKFTTFDLEIKGCGAFPAPSKGRVIWLGLAGEGDVLASLAKNVDLNMRRFGVEKEKRPFKSHITLARCKNPVDVTLIVREWEDWLYAMNFDKFHLDDIVLYQSVLSPQGPTYYEVKRFSLKQR